MKEAFSVPLNGLAPGRTRFHASAGKTFFAQFENAELLDADVKVSWEVEKTARELLVDGDLEGTLTVVCDRCLEDLVLPVVSSFALRIVFGAGEAAEEEDADGRETVYADPSLPGFDLSQTVYDYACLALPVQRVHPDGECNPDAVKHLHSESIEQKPEEGSSPFAALGELMKKKGVEE